jgi:hypothetical protein
MNDIVDKIYFPLDGGRFFRRECPLCREEFKIGILETELDDLVSKGVQNYLLDKGQTEEQESAESNDVEFFCPYCGQEASADSWWTQEQLAYIAAYGRNIIAKIVNEQLIDPLKRSSNRQRGGLITFEFKGKRMEYQEPCISPETDDMVVFPLPCCDREVKIRDNWNSAVHCFFCGFPHKNPARDR